jgi:hypothetical protein
LVIPGKSIRVRSTEFLSTIYNIIGLSTIPLFLPQTSSVNYSILYLISIKSKYFLSSPENYPYGFSSIFESIFDNLSSSGLHVTTPDPLGKKFKPTIDSSNELLPEL